MRIGCFSHVTSQIFLSSLHPSKYSCLRQNLKSSCIILAWHTYMHKQTHTCIPCAVSVCLQTWYTVHVCISGSSNMVMNVSSHMHVRVCGKGKNIIQETEYRPPAISGEFMLTHILCISVISLCFYISHFAILHFYILQEMLYHRLCGHMILVLYCFRLYKYEEKYAIFKFWEERKCAIKLCLRSECYHFSAYVSMAHFSVSSAHVRQCARLMEIDTTEHLMASCLIILVLARCTWSRWAFSNRSRYSQNSYSM